jgi:alpha-L-rhamnosidase
MDTSNWPSKPAAELFNNCYRLYLWDLHARAATALGKDEEATAARKRIQEIQPLVHAAFYDSAQQGYGPDEQAYRLMPLMTGVVPQDLRPAVMRRLEEGILSKGHLDTGMLGTYFLIHYLVENGRNDLLERVFSHTNYPGWGYMLAQGATTFWEQWNGFYSQIHSCFTSPGGWFYGGLAGIQPDESAPGFKRFIIRPALVRDLQWAKARYDSIHGRILSHWRITGQRLELEVTIPANTSATIFVPAVDPNQVMESGLSATQAVGVKLLREEEKTAVFEVGTGHYRFVSDLPSGLRAPESAER